jgi:glycosyltransferase involved in cell wall biosynthesis
VLVFVHRGRGRLVARLEFDESITFFAPMNISTSAENGAPAVSVVMPAYNHERFVGAAVESVCNQTFADLELVVVDDGSTDRTGEIVRSYRDPRVRYHHQRNQDAYNALNRGFSLARGGFIAVLNSDDVYAPNRLERLLAVQRESGAEFLFSDVVPMTDTGAVIEDPAFYWNVWHQGNRDFYFRAGDLYTGFLHGNFMITTSNLFLSRALAERVGPFAALRYLHDYDYLFRALLACDGNARYLHDEKLLRYRIHGSNTLSEAAITGREQDQAVIRKYLLAKCPKALHGYIETGVDRLIELERELQAVRAERAQPAAPAPSPSLLRRAGRRLRALARPS